MTELTRRAALGALGVGAVAGLAAGWPRLTAHDIPGRTGDYLQVAILGTNQDAAARANLVQAFTAKHPDIPVRIQAIQGTDWSDFFAKILTMVAAGTPPDVCVVATEGTQLFASRLAEPLDSYVKRDAAQLQDFFSDVHPSLIESFMFKGSLYQLPIDFNAANMYLNLSTLRKAGVDYPDPDWTVEDFTSVARKLNAANSGGGPFIPYYWTNRLWGGIIPWLYVNDTNIVREQRYSGGDWLWKQFYADDPAASGRGGGFNWSEPNATDDRVVESFNFVRELIAQGLGTSPAQGGGNQLVAQFAGGSVGMTPAGGFWVEGLNAAGMQGSHYDVQYFPKWRSQRAQFGSAGYAILKTSKRKDQAWEWMKFCVSREGMQLAFPAPNTTPVRRSMCNQSLYAAKGPAHWKVFYDTLDTRDAAPIPAPPNEAGVEIALIKNVSGAVTGSEAQLRSSLATLNDDLGRALALTY